MSRMTIGVVPLARPTFDVELAREVVAQAVSALESLAVDLVGPREPLFDADAVKAAMPSLAAARPDLLVVFQATFTDATMTLALAEAIAAPILLWSVTEPRSGGRLRLNSLCGVNLAAHALGKAGKTYGYVHGSPGDPGTIARIAATLKAERLRKRLAGLRIAVAGEHPAGFDTCAYDPRTLRELLGVEVERIDLPQLFARARAVPGGETDRLVASTRARYAEIDTLEQEPLRGSLNVYAALKALAAEQRYDGFAVRCWPEFFTELGCAACGAMALMNGDGIPCGCEADVFGTISTLMLQELGEAPAFMADLVDIDPASDSGVFWHCGLAPATMADPDEPMRATVHSNRKKPLVMEFALKPGRVTVARLSQSRNQLRLVIGGGEMQKAPKSFSGTSGVVRFDQPADAVLDTIMREGLEHHFSIAYGDHRDALARFADTLGLPMVSLT